MTGSTGRAVPAGPACPATVRPPRAKADRRATGRGRRSARPAHQGPGQARRRLPEQQRAHGPGATRIARGGRTVAGQTDATGTARPLEPVVRPGGSPGGHGRECQ